MNFSLDLISLAFSGHLIWSTSHLSFGKHVWTFQRVFPIGRLFLSVPRLQPSPCSVLTDNLDTEEAKLSNLQFPIFSAPRTRTIIDRPCLSKRSGVLAYIESELNDRFSWQTHSKSLWDDQPIHSITLLSPLRALWAAALLRRSCLAVAIAPFPFESPATPRRWGCVSNCSGKCSPPGASWWCLHAWIRSEGQRLCWLCSQSHISIRSWHIPAQSSTSAEGKHSQYLLCSSAALCCTLPRIQSICDEVRWSSGRWAQYSHPVQRFLKWWTTSYP